MKDLIIRTAQQTLQIEQKAIADLFHSFNDDFVKTVETIFNSTGRVIVTGIGKSAIVAQKIVATLNSTGTPSVFFNVSWL